jgi:hypothetical protein
MEIVNVGDTVILKHDKAHSIYELEIGKEYKISEVYHRGNDILILIEDSDIYYNLKRFKYGVKLIRKSKLDKLFSK